MSTTQNNNNGKPNPKNPLKGIRNSDLYDEKNNIEPELSGQFNDATKSDFGKSLEFLRTVKTQRGVSNALLTGDMSGEFGDTDLGRWRKDPHVTFGNFTQQDLQNYRAENQSRFWQAINGVGKFGVTALTTFADSFNATQAAGIVSGSVVDDNVNGSVFWYNPVQRAFAKLQNWSEMVMPNYYDSEGKGSATNFIFDKVVKNLGFAVGTVAAGYVAPELSLPGITTKVAGKIMKLFTKNALKLKNYSTWTRGYLTGLQSASVESAIEAINNTQEWYDSEKYELDYKLERGEIGETEYNNRISKLKEDRMKMGNADYLMNLLLLSASNYVQFGRALGAGFETQSRLVNLLREGKIYEATKQMPKVAAKSVKNALMEGFEEANQSLFSIVSGLAAEEDYLRYFDDTKNYKAQYFANNVINNFGKGMSTLLHDKQTFEEFSVGAIIGALGVPGMKRARVKNADGTYSTKPEFEWQGGIYGELRDYMNDLKYTQNLITPVNNRIRSGDMQSYYTNLLGHIINSDEQNASIVNRDKWAFKNSEFRDMYHDVVMFSRIGRTEDLKELINEDLGTDDASLDDIIKSTTKEVETEEGVKSGSLGFDKNGNPLNKEELRGKIEKAKQQLFNMIDNYQKTYEKLDLSTDGTLPEEGVETLTWMSMQRDNWRERAEDMYNNGTVKNTVSKYISDAINEIQQKQNPTEDDRSVLEMLQSLYGDISNFERIGQFLANNNQLYMFMRNRITDMDEINELEDFIKCCRGIYNFNNKLNSYIANPSELVEDLEEEEKRIQNEWYDDIIDEELKSINDEPFSEIKTFLKLKSYTTTPEAEEALLKRIEKKVEESENQKLKQEFEKYKNANEVGDSVVQAFNTLSEKQEGLGEAAREFVDSLSSYVKAEMYIGKTLDEIKKQVFEEYKDPELSDFLKNLFALVKGVTEVSNATKPDATKGTPEPATVVKGVPESMSAEQIADFFKSALPDDASVDKIEEYKADGIIPEETTEEELGELIDAEKEVKEMNSGISDNEAPSVEKANSNKLNPDDDPQDNSNKAKDTREKDSNKVTNWTSWKVEGKEKSETSLEGDIDSLKTSHLLIDSKNPLSAKLRNLGAYKFVNNGELDKLMRKSEKDGKALKVYYAFDTSEEHPTQYLVVEVDEAGEHTITEETKKDGKHYQVVGVLGGPIYDGGAKDPALEKQAQQSYAEFKKSGVNEGWYICQNTYNHVRKIYGGRFVKATDKVLQDVRNVGDVLINGEKIRNSLSTINDKIGFMVIRDHDDVSSVDDEDNIQRVNKYNAENLTGSVWMLTKQADGRWYPRYCSVKTTSKWKNSIDTTNNEVYREIKELCRTICNMDAKTATRMTACTNLMKYIYMGPIVKSENKSSWLNRIHFEGTLVKSKAFTALTLTGNIETDADALMSKLFSERSGLRMQFDAKSLKENSKSYTKYLINNNILETDLMQVENANTSFDMFPEAFGPSGSNKMTDAEVNEEVNRLRGIVPLNPDNVRPRRLMHYKNAEYVDEEGNGVWKRNDGKEMDVPASVLDFVKNLDNNSPVMTNISTKDEYYEFTDTDTGQKYYIERLNNNTILNIITSEVDWNNQLNLVKRSNSEVMEWQKQEQAHKGVPVSSDIFEETKKEKAPEEKAKTAQKKTKITEEDFVKPAKIEPKKEEPVKANGMSEEAKSALKSVHMTPRGVKKEDVEKLNKADSFKYWDVIFDIQTIRVPGINGNVWNNVGFNTLEDVRNAFVNALNDNVTAEKDLDNIRNAISIVKDIKQSQEYKDAKWKEINAEIELLKGCR